MSGALRAAGALALAGLASQACRYDLDALRPSDAAVDRPRPVDLGTPIDLGTPRDVPVDLGGSTDAGGDAGMARAGSCDMDGSVASLVPPIAPARAGSDAGVRLAYAMVSGDLRMAPTVALPTGNVDGGVLRGCSSADPMRTPPTRIYRYQAAEGGVVTATTNTQHCTGFDTRVYAIWSCKAADLANPASCGDDLRDGDDVVRCPGCGMAPDAGGNCSTLLSTLQTPETQPLRRGDVVFFAVTGYNINPGVFPHRLWVGENAARIEPFDLTARPTPVSRCVCQDTTQGARTVFFPYQLPLENFPTTVTTSTGMSTFLGVRDLPAGSYSGVSLQLRILRWNLAASCRRDVVRAVFDLIAGGALVTTFSIPATFTPPVTVTVPYTAFAPTMLSRVAAGTGMALELRLRDVRPEPACLTLDLDPAPGASAITLYGGG